MSVAIVEVVTAVAVDAVCTAYTAYVGDQAFACWSQYWESSRTGD
jgi:hypothetical protein